MNNLLKRGTSGFIYVLLFMVAILYSQVTFIIFTSIFGLICIFEFSKIVSLKSALGYIVFIGFVVLILQDHTLLKNHTFFGIQILLFIALSGSIQVLTNLYLGNTKYPIHDFQKLDITIRYLVMSFVFLLLIPFASGDFEPYILINLLLLIWTNDSFAYLVGVNFGKTKLCKKISPNKTVEGFLGGIFFTLITAVIISNVSNLFTLKDWLILGLIASVLGTTGDLIESKFKRRAQIKDSGNIMPGHGGMLDRLDSLLFVSPFVYLYISYII